MIQYIEPPASEYLEESVTVTLEGHTLHPYQARVSAVPYNKVWPGCQRPDDQTEYAAFFSLTADQPVPLRADFGRPVETAVVRPLSQGVPVAVSGSAVELTLPGPGQYVLEADGFHGALHIFINPPAPVPQPAPGLLFYGKGVHRTGVVRLESGQTVYLADGAVVYGGFTAIGASDIRVLGPGIIDGSYEQRRTDTRSNPNLHYSKAYHDMDVTQDMNLLEKALRADRVLSGCLRFYNCKNVTVSGPVLRDTATYGMIAAASENVLVENVKLIGMWKYNTDGIDLFNSKNVTIDRCFLRTFDDSIVLKGIKGWDTHNMENILVRRCVVWCDWGRNLEIGAETNAPLYRNIFFTDCDLIHATMIMMDIQHTGRAHIQDVTFDNIRCEYNRRQLPWAYQYNLEEKYPSRDAENTQQPVLICITNSFDFQEDPFGGDTERGRVTRVNFRDIQILADPDVAVPVMQFQGADAQHAIEDVVVEGVSLNGRPLAPAELPIEKNAFVSLDLRD